MINYYEILQVDNYANDEDIKAKYRELIAKAHPDKGGDALDFQRIKEAYEILKDKDKKNNFDNKLAYYLEIVERAEDIKINPITKEFTCIQCHSINKIEEVLDYNKDNITKCQNCSMIYKIIL